MIVIKAFTASGHVSAHRAPVAELDFNTQAAAVTPEPPAAEKDR
jgi:hypothetical protein